MFSVSESYRGVFRLNVQDRLSAVGTVDGGFLVGEIFSPQAAEGAALRRLFVFDYLVIVPAAVVGESLHVGVVFGLGAEADMSDHAAVILEPLVGRQFVRPCVLADGYNAKIIVVLIMIFRFMR